MIPGGFAQTTPSIPVSVWEQVGIVVLLFVIVIPGIFAAVRWLLNDQRKAQLSSQQALLKQQQDFIEKRDGDWQTFFTDIRQADSQAVQRLTEVIDKVVTRLESLETKFDKHDAAEMEFLRGIEKQPQTRRKV